MSRNEQEKKHEEGKTKIKFASLTTEKDATKSLPSKVHLLGKKKDAWRGDRKKKTKEEPDSEKVGEGRFWSGDNRIIKGGAWGKKSAGKSMVP